MKLSAALAPLFVSFAVACGAADAGSDEPGPTASDNAKTSTTKSGSTSTTSTTQSAALPGSNDESDPTSAPASDAALAGSEASGSPAATPVASTTGLHFRGVNLAGAEFAYTALPGVEGRDYGWPTHSEVDYFTAKGMNTFRVGFLWERMQSKAFGDLTSSYVAKLDEIVGYATSHNANVILNPHNFAKYYGVPVGTAIVPNAAFADFWGKLAARYASNPRVMFNLMNEPNGLPTEQWVGAANAAIASIRTAGAQNLIMVPGNAWTGAHSWSENWYGTSNAKAMLAIIDPANHYVYEVHQYLDTTSGGIVGDCVSATVGSERLQGWINWLRANGRKGFVGEFAGGNNALCNTAVTDMLETMKNSSDVLEGWLWWAAGPRWNPTYPFSIEPKDGQDAPQMSLLTPYLH